MANEPLPAQPQQQQAPHPQRLTLKANHGTPETSETKSLPKGPKTAAIAVCCSLFFLCFGAAAGWFGQQSIENGQQYERYAAELFPLIYYKDRVHAAKERGSNETMRIVNYKIYQAHSDGLDIEKLLELAQPTHLQPPPLAKLNSKRFKDNLRLGIEYGIYEGEANLKALAYGKAPTITKGEFAGERIDVEHVVPKSIAPGLDNILANLMWYPASLNQSKNNTITQEAMDMAEVFADEGILQTDELLAVKKAYR